MTSFFRAGARFLLLFTLGSGAAQGAGPGFTLEPMAPGIPGFITSLVADSQGIVYCTTLDGWIHRIEADGTSVQVASLPTLAHGNAGLLGMALIDDVTAAVHYTVSNSRGDKVLADVVGIVDLQTATSMPLHSFVCDIDDPADGSSDEHHGGNLTVGADGAIYLGIGEYGGRTIAQKPQWNGGKLWRVDLAGNATQWALGMRNPFDLAFDPDLNALVVTDNGPTAGDELNVVPFGGNCGWPKTAGFDAPLIGAIPPVYVFPTTVAPTGLHRLRGSNALLRAGYLSGTFVTREIHFFPTVTSPATPAPYSLVEGSPGPVIDVTEMPSGQVLAALAFGASSAIYRLVPPLPGDCNGDAMVDWRDLLTLLDATRDGSAEPVYSTGRSWGCDANVDLSVDAADVETLRSLIARRRRAVR